MCAFIHLIISTFLFVWGHSLVSYLSLDIFSTHQSWALGQANRSVAIPSQNFDKHFTIGDGSIDFSKHFASPSDKPLNEIDAVSVCVDARRIVANVV